jgi:transcriptional regulator with XRE-family HTH domain
VTLNTAVVNVGEKVRSARVRRGMSLGRLALASGLTKGFISQVEHGRSQPSLDSLGRIASSLDLSLHALLGNQERADIDQPAPSLPQLFRLAPERDAKTGVETLVSRSAGTMAVAYLAEGASISPGGRERTVGRGQRAELSTAMAFCVVIGGAAVFVQDGAEQALAQGDALAWDAGRSYRIENRDRAVCTLLLSLDARGDLPVASAPELAPAVPSGRAPVAPPAVPVEGPLRLVAMRAQRRGKGR